MNTFRSRLSLFTAFVALAAAPLLPGQFIYDNLGNGNLYTPSSGYTIGNGSNEIAFQFTAGDTLLLDFADLQIWGSRGSTPFVNVAILSDSGLNTPGAVLEMVTVPLSPFVIAPIPLVRAEFSNTTLLLSGTHYWLAVSPLDSTTNTAWQFLISNPLGLLAFDVGQIGLTDPWTQMFPSIQEAGMRISGVAPITAVPEPSTYGLVAAACLFSAIAVRRRLNNR